MIEQVGPEFELTENAVRQRQATLLEKADFKPAVAVNR
jgi:hypothetical protein